jgi:hypothetical protein
MPSRTTSLGAATKSPSRREAARSPISLSQFGVSGDCYDRAAEQRLSFLEDNVPRRQRQPMMRSAYQPIRWQ